METKNLTNLTRLPWGKSAFWYWNGHRCYWSVLGEDQSPPIVLLHGFGASSDHWRNNAARYVEEGFCVYAIDLIGFGKSDQPSYKRVGKIDNRFWSMQLIAFIEEIVRKANHQKVVLIGNSLGGLVALNTVVFRPDLVSAVITAPLPDPAFLHKVESPKARPIILIKEYLIKLFFQLIPLKLLLLIITRSRLILIALQSAYYRSIGLDKELHELVIRPARRSSASDTLRAMCIGMSLRPKAITGPYLLEQLEKHPNKPPFLMLWGRQDRLVPLQIGKEIARKYSWVKLQVLEFSGHCPHDESYKEFNNCVLSWLALNLVMDTKKA